MKTPSIFNPKSQSYKFYKNVFDNISMNNMLHAGGLVKWICDMDETEFNEYMEYVATYVDDNQKS